MDFDLAQKAISLALQGKWEEALGANLEILEKDPANVDALNRTSRAYSEIGKLKEAKDMAKKVLEIDPVNTIAIKSIQKLQNENGVHKNGQGFANPNMFLEDPGKTKLVSLLNPGDEKLIASFDPGAEVKLSTHSHKVCVTDNDGKYLGCLPDDLSARIKNLIKLGNKYRVFVKSIKPKEMSVFIRETEKGPDVDTTSFPPEKIEYVAYTPPELVHQDVPININEGPDEV